MASDNSGCLKVAEAVALAEISYDFKPSKIMKTRIGSMESYAHYFPKGYGRPLGVESVSEFRANEAIIFEDFFLLQGFVYHRIQFLWIFCTSFKCSCII
jgi:hypothetical protein